MTLENVPIANAPVKGSAGILQNAEHAISHEALHQDGFTGSGSRQYTKTVDDYATTLRTKAVLFAEAAKSEDTGREVTHDHVRMAAHAISAIFGQKPTPSWVCVLKVLEYPVSILAGVAGANMNQALGAVSFGVCVAFLAASVAARNVTKG